MDLRKGCIFTFLFVLAFVSLSYQAGGKDEEESEGGDRGDKRPLRKSSRVAEKVDRENKKDQNCLLSRTLLGILNISKYCDVESSHGG